MQQYLFNKQELKDLITASDPAANVISITVGYAQNIKENQMLAKIEAKAIQVNATGQPQVLSGGKIAIGCPYPPGCPAVPVK